MSNSILYHCRQSKTQKRDAALRAASLFWVLCSDKTSDSYKHRFFESLPTADFQKTNLRFSAPKALKISNWF